MWGRAEAGSGRVAARGRGGAGQRRHPAPNALLRRAFLSCVPSFFLFYFLCLFPRDHKLCLKEGNSRTSAATGTGVRPSEFSASVLFFMASHVCGVGTVGLQCCHGDCIALDGGGGPRHTDGS